MSQKLSKSFVVVCLLVVGLVIGCTPTPTPEEAPALTITPAAVSGIGATISWTTDVSATTEVEYGTSDAYGSKTTKDNTMTTDHKAYIAGLTKNTTYHYKVKSANDAGTESGSSDQTFATKDDASHFPFEVDTMGWHVSLNIGEQAITSVAQSATDKHEGTGSLKLIVDLVTDAAGAGAKSGGLAYVDLLTNAPPGVKNGTVDMTGKTLSAWINISATGFTGGGITIYALDSSDNYSSTTNVDDLGAGWQQISGALDTTAPFDVTKVKRIGINLHRGYVNANAFSFAGTVYLDSVTW